MRKANVYMHGIPAGTLAEIAKGKAWEFAYLKTYSGPPISLTMPVEDRIFSFREFPPFFEGLLPEGIMLEGMLRQLKIDRKDYFSQLLATGEDLVGAVTVKPCVDE